MEHFINSEVVVAYTQCQLKAFYLLCTEKKGTSHEYLSILEKQTRKQRKKYIDTIQLKSVDACPYSSEGFAQGKKLMYKATLCYRDLQDYADVLTRVGTLSSQKNCTFEPTLVIGNYSIAKEQKLQLSFLSYILSKLQDSQVASGTIVDGGRKPHKVKVEAFYKEIQLILKNLRLWTRSKEPETPPIMLNRHCPYCSFEPECKEKAEEKDDLSLLGGMTPKMIQKYHKKGIFTVTQLSYVFRPRKARKKKTKSQLHYRPEVQALALRSEKIYIHELPNISRQPIELFLDIEGVPDKDFYYLIGLMISKGQERSFYSFWASSRDDERHMWNSFIETVSKYSNSPIYHYSSYDARAIRKLIKRYGKDEDIVHERLINVNFFIYGKIYFPVRSNALKELGRFMGFSWSHPDASGLQSLVWRYYWEEDQVDQYRKLLLTYNKEDCEALWLLTEKLSEVISTAKLKWNIDFIDQPKKHSTETGGQIHKELKQILQYAHADYNKKKINLKPSKKNNNKGDETQKKNLSSTYVRIAQKPVKIVRVPRRRTCPRCRQLVETSKKIGEKIIIDLVFTRNGCRKTVTKYIGNKCFCRECRVHHNPKMISDFGRRLFGHAFIAWTVYHRIVLRLPYHLIVQVMEDTFGERVTNSTLVEFVRCFAQYYSKTEKCLVRHLLASPIIHVDETRINIQGESHYVWGFTDGKHVVLRKTETREATIAHEFLSNYTGVVITDFYPGYDSLQCRQQKCWSHLIGDINDDLWKEPFNLEFERFVLEIRNLIIPIFQAVQTYGLKKRYLHKFKKYVDRFYKRHIDNQNYTFEVTIKYQKRFQRYKNSLFTFLEIDGIPWNNNMAERALRHLAVQRKISNTFHDSFVSGYLLLLSMGQTCRFQNKPFLKFLVSQQKDIDLYKVPKSKKYSRLAKKIDKSGDN